ncbi:tumor necrosis factor ligand superfamily member 6-like [Rhinatrema bivittatum]|uniref:tumor necrosis factor ligand superfamily member 6-like n=1 Tax=Rhinatrema bivittatum TaxID=194408 RepID=UPI001129143E|nr:tumor necrosis factor ligand superfamily member 6-like [Rhinatrema bivittatum]
MKGAKHVAHLTGRNNTQALLIDWDSRGLLSFTAGVEYKNGGLIVPLNGLYFVYSNVDFQQQSCENTLLRHQVLRRLLLYPNYRVLMESMKKNSCEKSSRWAQSSYLGAVYNLTKSDALYVHVSNVALVNFEGSKTYFGLYKL